MLVSLIGDSRRSDVSEIKKSYHNDNTSIDSSVKFEDISFF